MYIFKDKPDEKYIIYDLECFPNIFTAFFHVPYTDFKIVFEISNRRNDLLFLLRFLDVSRIYVGFNNLGYDYPLLHHIILSHNDGMDITPSLIYKESQRLINTPWANRHNSVIKNPIYPQLDLMKVHHFDNANKLTGLKTLECNMRLFRVEELPFMVGSMLTDSEMDILIKYNAYDVFAAYYFFMLSRQQITLREKLGKIYNADFTNFSNTKIGSTICKNVLKKSGIPLYRNGKLLQTRWENVPLDSVIFKYITFKTDDFKNVYNTLCGTVADKHGKFKDIIFNLDNVKYKVASGGLHASVENKTYKSNSGALIVDVDVAGFYPDLSIKNDFFPIHLGIGFCVALNSIKQDRKRYKKGTSENVGLKEAMNATFGNSNQQYSSFFDVSYMLKTTINGQLLLLMLVERLMVLESFKMIQGNTDGITFNISELEHPLALKICEDWEKFTNLKLEYNYYSRMWIANVNNYVAEYESGKLKRKGCYGYGNDLVWNKNYSSQIVAIAAVNHMVRGVNVEQFIKSHTITEDFLIHSKIPRTSQLIRGDEKIPNISRYLITKNGKGLTKVMPATGVIGEYKRARNISDDYYFSILEKVGIEWDERIHTKNKSTHEIRKIAVQKGRNVTLYNTLRPLDDVDYEYYFSEVEKILID